MIWWQNTVIMQLSCKCAWWAFCSTYSTYVVLQADSACKMHINWYMMWYLKKDMFCKEHDLFWWFVIFKMVCLSSVFWLVWPSSIIQRTHSTWNSFVHLRVFSYAREILHSCAPSHLAIACMIAQTIFSGGPGFELLALHTIDFCESRVQTPACAARSFCGSRVWFPGLDCLF